MKQLRFLLSPSLKKDKFVGVAKKDNKVNKSNSKVESYKFPFSSKSTSNFSRRKWLMGKIKWLRRATHKDFLYTGSFQEAIGSTLAFAQIFGMPVIGVKEKSATSLRFQWKSIRFGYCFVMFIFMLAYAGMTFWTVVSGDIAFDRIIPFIFYGSGVYGMLSFGLLARKWPRIMRRWELIETQLPKYRTQQEKRKLACHMKILAIIVLSASLIEHILNIISILYYSRKCLNQKEPLKELLRTNLSQLFTYLPYSHWIAFFGKWINISATFSWSYMDLFVMMMSLGLSSNFRRINEDLLRVKGEHMSEDFWAMRRTQYRKLAGLCATVDDAISHITLLSFSNNFVFICVTLLRSIKPMASIPHAIYFWFSLTFLIARTLAVSLYAAKIYDDSKIPMEVLRAVPNVVYLYKHS